MEKNQVGVTSGRLDRIYLMEAFPKAYPSLKFFSLFEKAIDKNTEYCASDYYGVVAKIVID